MPAPRDRTAVRSAEDRWGEALLRVARTQMRILRRAASAEGLSMPQFFALNWIARHGPVPTTGWAQRMGASPSTVSGLFDGLERLGYLSRRPDPADRRRILVTVRPAARRLAGRIDARRRGCLHEVWASLPAAERDPAARLLDTLASRMEDAAGLGPRPIAPEVGAERGGARRRAGRSGASPRARPDGEVARGG